MIKRRTRIIRYISIAVCLILAAVLTAQIDFCLDNSQNRCDPLPLALRSVYGYSA